MEMLDRRGVYPLDRPPSALSSVPAECVVDEEEEGTRGLRWVLPHLLLVHELRQLVRAQTGEIRGRTRTRTPMLRPFKQPAVFVSMLVWSAGDAAPRRAARSISKSPLRD